MTFKTYRIRIDSEKHKEICDKIDSTPKMFRGDLIRMALELYINHINNKIKLDKPQPIETVKATPLSNGSADRFKKDMFG